MKKWFEKLSKTNRKILTGAILIHIPNVKYPENTGFFTELEQIGSLRQEATINFMQKYGDNYCFVGKIIDADSVEKNDETYFDIITEIRIPIINKSVKKYNK